MGLESGTRRFDSFDWDPNLCQRRRSDEIPHSKLWIESIAQDDDVLTAFSNADNDVSVVEAFMRGFGRLKSNAPATAVQKFCSGVTWASFRYAEKSDARSKRTTSACVGGPNGGENLSPLSAFDLYRQLLPRSLPPEAGSLNQETVSKAYGTPASEHQRQEYDEDHNDEADKDMLPYDRRIIFISNLDPTSVWALIGTVPSHQAGFLRDTLESHLCRAISIAADFAPRGFKNFTMAFHLAFVSLTTTEGVVSEPSKPASSAVVQEKLDVSFMDWRSNKSVIVHRSHVSCALYGLDRARYQVLCLVSSCGDASAETVEHYIHSAAAQHNDPCLLRDDGSMTIEGADLANEPREYWLCVLNKRLEVTVDEWKVVRLYLQDSVDAADIYKPSIDVVATEEWIFRARDLIMELQHTLASAVSACEDFLSSYHSLFSPDTCVDQISRTTKLTGFLQTELREFRRLSDKLELFRDIIRDRIKFTQRLPRSVEVKPAALFLLATPYCIVLMIGISPVVSHSMKPQQWQIFAGSTLVLGAGWLLSCQPFVRHAIGFRLLMKTVMRLARRATGTAMRQTQGSPFNTRATTAKAVHQRLDSEGDHLDNGQGFQSTGEEIVLEKSQEIYPLEGTESSTRSRPLGFFAPRRGNGEAQELPMYTQQHSPTLQGSAVRAFNSPGSSTEVASDSHTVANAYGPRRRGLWVYALVGWVNCSTTLLEFNCNDYATDHDLAIAILAQAKQVLGWLLLALTMSKIQGVQLKKFHLDDHIDQVTCSETSELPSSNE